jgi:hypothetical protein
MEIRPKISLSYYLNFYARLNIFKRAGVDRVLRMSFNQEAFERRVMIYLMGYKGDERDLFEVYSTPFYKIEELEVVGRNNN